MLDLAIIINRAGFQSIAEIFNYTVRRGKEGRTTKLTGSVLLEAWCIFALLKHRQGVGETSFRPLTRGSL